MHSGVREVLCMVSTTILMLFPVLLNGSVAFGAPCRARLALHVVPVLLPNPKMFACGAQLERLQHRVPSLHRRNTRYGGARGGGTGWETCRNTRVVSSVFISEILENEEKNQIWRKNEIFWKWGEIWRKHIFWIFFHFFECPASIAATFQTLLDTLQRGVVRQRERGCNGGC